MCNPPNTGPHQLTSELESEVYTQPLLAYIRYTGNMHSEKE